MPCLLKIASIAALFGRSEFHPGPEGTTRTFFSGRPSEEQIRRLENSETVTTASLLRADSVENKPNPIRRLVDISTTGSR